jgi:small-conductance mechanosensitive channel
MDVKNQRKQSGNLSSKKSVERDHRYWIGGYSVIAVVFLIIYFLLKSNRDFPESVRSLLYEKISLGGFCVFVVLVVGRFIELLIVKNSQSKTLRYTLVRVIRLVTMLVTLIVVVTFLFHNWYTAAVSLGLISLILGFALQVPISSFIAWLYIIFRTPYRVGDRIAITEFKGDVVEIGYLDTTLWEFGGDYLTTDVPSGRLIRFPNSLVLQSAVFNYSWPKFPYIWNEISFDIAYGSDFNFVETVLKETTRAELDPEMAEKIQILKELISQTPVDELEIKEYPFVSFRTNSNTWVEALVTYLVEPKRATATRTRIIKQAISALREQSEKVMFPKGDSR